MSPVSTTNSSEAADPASLPPLPKDHLDHPEQWVTGNEPATDKQKGFIKVLEGKSEDLVPETGIDVDHLGKSEASEVIDKLKKGEPVGSEVTGKNGHHDTRKSEKDQDAADSRNVEQSHNKASGEMAQGSAESELKNPSSPASKKRKATQKSSLNDSTETALRQEGEEPNMTSGDEGDDESMTPKASKSHIQHGDTSVPSGADASDEKEEADEGHQTKRARLDKENADGTETPADEEPVTPSMPTNERISASAQSNGDAAHGKTIPGDGEHLDHPENWSTGDEPATEKQKAFVAVLEKKSGVSVSNKDTMGKSEASEIIDELKGKAD